MSTECVQSAMYTSVKHISKCVSYKNYESSDDEDEVVENFELV